MNEEIAQIEMPRYQCHKEVWALQIKDVDPTGTMISFVDDKYAPRVVGADWITKHKPQPNGYFVVYRDGYESYSPQKAFEEGYSKIEPRSHRSNRVTPEQISALLDNAESQEHTFWEKELLVSYKLPSGFTISGRGACVDPANFDIEIGRKFARQDAEKQLWQLEGYRLQNELHEKGFL